VKYLRGGGNPVNGALGTAFCGGWDESRTRIYYHGERGPHFLNEPAAAPAVPTAYAQESEPDLPLADPISAAQLKQKVAQGHVLSAEGMAILRQRAEDEYGEILLPSWAIDRLRSSSGTVADACETKLSELRRELAVLQRQYPELDWRPLAMLETEKAGRLGREAADGMRKLAIRDVNPAASILGGVSTPAVARGMDNQPRWGMMPPPRTLIKRVPPGTRPIGYRVRHLSSPAVSMSKKWVLSRNVDPNLPDDNPGPGAYDIGRPIH